MPRQAKTAKERAEYRLGVAERAYTQAVNFHAAAGPWDDALRITTDAEHVADLYRRLAARDTP